MSDRWIERWEVTGTSGKPYTVARDRDNKFGCSCPAWKFRKGEKVDCAHILRIKLDLQVPASGFNSQQVKLVEKNLFAVRSVRLED